ncbi:MAG: outer membrane beta-barrel protein [bacterium]
MKHQLISKILGITLFAMIGAVLMAASLAQAQAYSAGVNFLVGVPKGEFRDNIDNQGFGLGGHVGYHFGQSPFMAGLDLGFMIYGSETRKERFSTTIPDVTVDVETTNNIFLGHFLLRMQAPHGTFRPYIDGVIGMHYLFTETDIRDENDIFDETIASSTNQEDVAFSYGTGGGLLFQVHKANPNEVGEKKKLQEVLIDFRVRYLFGSESEYLKKGSIRREGGAVIYDVITSRTDILNVRLGVVFVF